MATETEMTAAREPGPGQVPVLVTRLGGQQRIFPVGARVRVGRDPAFELVSVNPLVSRQCHGLITSDQGGATYVDQSRRGTFLDGKQLNGPLRITESVVLRLGDPATGEELGITPPLTSAEIARNHGRRILGGRMRRGALAGVAVAAVAGLATFGFFTLRSGIGGRRPVRLGAAARGVGDRPAADGLAGRSDHRRVGHADQPDRPDPHQHPRRAAGHARARGGLRDSDHFSPRPIRPTSRSR